MRIPTGQGLAALMLGAAALAPATAAYSSTVDGMLDYCRTRAAERLEVSPDTIRLIYEGKSKYGAHGVTGATEATPPVTFACTFDANGDRLVKFMLDPREGCPPSMTEADPSKFPGCE